MISVLKCGNQGTSVNTETLVHNRSLIWQMPDFGKYDYEIEIQ
jgi:hypothetical protein